jgi:hypothetical protein
MITLVTILFLHLLAALVVASPTQMNNVRAPVVTSSPRLRQVLRREAVEASANTCGYVSGSFCRSHAIWGSQGFCCPVLSDRFAVSSITCASTAICATNTYFGVHGCCDASVLGSCTIATTCIASTAISLSCTDAACSSNDAIAKCTDDGAPECYRWLFDYGSTLMVRPLLISASLGCRAACR